MGGNCCKTLFGSFRLFLRQIEVFRAVRNLLGSKPFKLTQSDFSIFNDLDDELLLLILFSEASGEKQQRLYVDVCFSCRGSSVSDPLIRAKDSDQWCFFWLDQWLSWARGKTRLDPVSRYVTWMFSHLWSLYLYSDEHEAFCVIFLSFSESMLTVTVTQHFVTQVVAYRNIQLFSSWQLSFFNKAFQWIL